MAKNLFKNQIAKLKLSSKSRLILHWVLFLFILLIISMLAYKINTFLKSVKVKEIVVYGASKEVEKVIYAKVRQLNGVAILSINIEKLDELITKMPWIDSVAINRNLNGRLTIFIMEKNPYFLWQDDNGDYRIIDSNNNIVNIKLNFSLDNLIIIEKGIFALENSDNIRFLIYKDFSILKNIKKLIFNGYRWDIHLKNGLVIKLPEQNMDKAYDLIIKANNKSKLLSKKVQYIDATSENKLFIAPSKK